MARVHGHKEAEVRMGSNDASGSILGSLFIENKCSVGLCQRVQSVQNRRVAEVGVVKNDPGSILDSPCQNTLSPLKANFHFIGIADGI
jgi:hypothetical protein